MRERLKIPAQIVFVVTASACSSSPSTQDASVDVALDALADALVNDAPGADTPLTDSSHTDARDALTADRTCTVDPFNPEGMRKSVRCLPRRGATMPCPQENVCVEADCPSHCEGCVSPLFCIPDSENDAGVSCVVGSVCSEEACNPGCRAVG